MKKYDYVLVGSGLFAGVWAYLAGKKGKTCLVVEKRDHTGGNVYCEDMEGIHVHRYGAHIFHTSNREVWDSVKQERQRRGGVRPGECGERSRWVQGFVNPERKVAPEPQS